MLTKICRTCSVELPYDKEHYHIGNTKRGKNKLHSPDCRICYAKRHKLARSIEKENGNGSDHVFQKPGKYADDIQKKQVFAVMEMMKWKYNEEKNIWYDDIKKTKDGKFIGVWEPQPKEKKPRVRKKVYTLKEKKRKNVTELPFISMKKASVVEKYSKEFVTEIQVDYFHNTMKLSEIFEKNPNDKKFIRYIINRSLKIIKEKRDANEQNNV
jgi:hypothetical protein